MPFLSPNRVKALQGKNITFHVLAYPKLTWGLPTLSLTTKGSWLPWGGLPCFSSPLWRKYRHFFEKPRDLNTTLICPQKHIHDLLTSKWGSRVNCVMGFPLANFQLVHTPILDFIAFTILVHVPGLQSNVLDVLPLPLSRSSVFTNPSAKHVRQTSCFYLLNATNCLLVGYHLEKFRTDVDEIFPVRNKKCPS